MSTEIYYNNKDAFSGISATPFVSRVEEPIRFGERWSVKEVVRLQGALTGKCLSFNEMVSKQSSLVANFSKDFQALEVKDNSSTVLKRDFVKINSIDFNESSYSFGYLPFTIELECYPSGYFVGAYGVSEPSEETLFSENEDGIIRLVHNISAKGFTTNSNHNDGLNNAKSWVNSRTGNSSSVLPRFISYSSFEPCLFSISEQIDRLNSSYSVSETYLADSFSSDAGILRYSTEYSTSLEEGTSFVIIQGTIDGCKQGTIEDVRNRFQSFDAFNEALNQFFKITNRTDLYFRPITKTVSEDPENLKLSFSYTFSDDLSPEIFFEYKINFDYDFDNDIITAKIDGTILSTHLAEDRWANILDYAEQINLYNILLPSFSQYVGQVAPHLSDFPLNPVPIVTSRSENEFDLRLSLSATYSNRVIQPNGLLSYDYTLNFSPALHQYSPNPVLDGYGDYVVFDLGFNSRARCDLELRGVGGDNLTADQVLELLKTNTLVLQNQYFPGTRKNLDSQKIIKSSESFSKNITIQASYSAEQNVFNLS